MKKDNRKEKTFADDMLDAIRSGQIDSILSNDKEVLRIKLAKVEEALKKSEIKYRSIFENANDSIFFMDSDTFVDCNRKTLELFGCENKADMVGHHPWEYSPKYQPDGQLSKIKARNYIEAAYKGIPQKFEWIHCKKNGEEFVAEVSLNAVKIIKNTYLLAIVRDVTERVRFTNKLKQSEELFRTVIENSNDVIYLLYNNKFELINEKFTELTGYTLEEVNSEDFHFFKLVAQRSIEKINERIRKVEAEEVIDNIYEFYVLAKDGREIPCEASVSYANYKDGMATLGILRDISERKEYERSLIEAKEKAEEADRLKSEFLAQISHEIRTPLNTLLNYSYLVQEEIKERLGGELDPLFNTIKSAGERIIRTIDLLINMSELQAGTYKPNLKKISLCKIVEPLVSEFTIIAERKSLSLHYIDICSQCDVYADEYSVTKIVDNLIDNAIKYTNEGEITVSIFEEGEYLCISVEDTGIGIDEEYLPIIFEPFTQEEQGYTRNFEGNGLGLALVKKYCEMNNAEIKIKSIKGKGSVFTVVFPKYKTA